MQMIRIYKKKFEGKCVNFYIVAYNETHVFAYNYVIKISTYLLSISQFHTFAVGLELSKQLEGWLSAADLSHGPARAIIAPLVIVQCNIFLKFYKMYV